MASEDKSRRTQPAPSDPRKGARGHARARHSARRLSLDSEQSARLLLIGGVGLLVVLALGFVAFGWYWTEKRPLGRTVLQVDEYKVSYAAMKRRMNYELFLNTSLQQDPSLLPTVAYDNLVDELTKIARAGDLGVGFDEVTFEEKLRGLIGVSADADRRAFQDALRRQLEVTGLKEGEYRRLVLADALETAIKDKYTAELPANIPQAQIEVISAPTREDAQKAIDRINAGEAFADVAKSISQDVDVQTTGGLQEYTADGNLNEAYNDFAFSAEIGQLSAPLAATTGSMTSYVVRVIDRSDQPVREDQKPGLARTKYDDWLASTIEEMQSSGALVNHWDDHDKQEALVEVYEDARPRLIEEDRQRQEQQQQQLAAQLTAVAVLTASPAASTPAAGEGDATPGAEGSPPVAGTPAAESTPPAETSPATEGGDGVTPPSQPVAPSQP